VIKFNEINLENAKNLLRDFASIMKANEYQGTWLGVRVTLKKLGQEQ
jgi:hypothetical protein